MLRLVHPPPGGKEQIRPPKRRGTRAPALRLTDVEAMRLRAALRNLKALPAFGTWPKLAAAMKVPVDLIHNIVGGSHPSPATAMAVARLTGTTIDALLGEPKPVRLCPHCGGNIGGST